MRIIAGKFKRKKLIAPEGHQITRPTSDRIKESVFNILSADIADSCVIDLFAGSGALGIEALSRGAQYVVFVENNIHAVKSLQANLKSLGVNYELPISVLSKDVSLFLTKASQILSSKSVNKFSIIFADPPYASKWYDTAIEELENSNICADNCLFVVEMSEDRKSLFVPEKFQSIWMKLDERIYGKTKLEFWRRNCD